MLEKQISNRYLKESKVIRAKSELELEQKVKIQKHQWKKKEEIQKMKDAAFENTRRALSLVEEYRSLLTSSLSYNHIIDWDKLMSYSPFSKSEPLLDTYIDQIGVPSENLFLETLFSSLKKKRIDKEREAKKLYYKAFTEYQYEKNSFINMQKEKNQKVENFKSSLHKGESETIEKYIKKVLSNSPYPSAFTKDFDLQYDGNSRSLIVEYFLPHPERIPRVIEYKYVQTRKEVDEKIMKDKDFQQYYDDVLYQITLRTIYECISADYVHHIETIIFNGLINGIDTSTGNEFTSCILSLHVDKEEFMKLNLERIVPKDCFQKLKGLSAGPLHQIAPVKPIQSINKEDKRFVDSKEMLTEANSIPNLAQMPWEDFEHLVSGLFRLYFERFGGEVKVTRASREGGVDAIGFDPDPIRGGKIIIQAKRYNKVVPVAHVRELNGIMNHEKAIKGILVTTSYFGKDSWNFIKDTHIELIDGPRLLHLFNEFGYNVRIDIKKKITKQKKEVN
ncbi:restriction system protein [Salirhabdus euzebyi]|uniref:Restriction system protein n=1 Tax=Salirhabdus euzebyi TaxID=394506 RepID=A0A841PSJ3_9BACI|nr:restriction endonuclease [Salirhabdus euzebyi]MBB6451779.1 restriction system protein [Salirhabdus euzebyi]